MATFEADHLSAIYSERFQPNAHSARSDIWRVLVSDFFQAYVNPTDVVLDVAAGNCEFINHIEAADRIAVDLNPDVARNAADGVRVMVTRASALRELADGTVDVAFASNVLEHLERSEILGLMSEVRRVIRPGGRFLILQPNVRYCAKDYWMFFDHITPLDDRSVAEALGMTGFDVDQVISRFLPYTTKGRLPQAPWMVKAYLHIPIAWRVLGKQSFLVARPSG